MSQAMHVESGYIRVDGARLYYELAGQGEPLVLLHAGIADSRMWEPRFEVFARRFRVLRYDARGFGRSTNSDTRFSRRADLLQIMDALGLDRAHLVGCSMDGKTRTFQSPRA